MNVKTLKEILEDLPDEMEVFICDIRPIDFLHCYDVKMPAKSCTINREENFISIQHIDLSKK